MTPPTTRPRPGPRARRYAVLVAVGLGLLLAGLIGQLNADGGDARCGGLVVEVVDAEGHAVPPDSVQLHLLHLESERPPVKARPGERLSLPAGRWEVRALTDGNPPLRRQLLVSAQATAHVRLRLGE